VMARATLVCPVCGGTSRKEDERPNGNELVVCESDEDDVTELYDGPVVPYACGEHHTFYLIKGPARGA